MLLPVQNQENTAAIPSFLSVSPDDEEEKGTLLLLVQIIYMLTSLPVHARQLLRACRTHRSVSSMLKT